MVLPLCYSIYEPAGLPDLLGGKGRGWEEEHWLVWGLLPRVLARLLALLEEA